MSFFLIWHSIFKGVGEHEFLSPYMPTRLRIDSSQVPISASLIVEFQNEYGVGL